MKTIGVNKTNISISQIGLGCGNWGREVDEQTAFNLMDYAIDNGITFFDTSELYGGLESYQTRKKLYDTDDVRETTLESFSSEKIIGRWLKTRGSKIRDKVTLCTKVGTGGSKENVHRALSDSLKRLQVDYVDIFKLHLPDATTEVLETLSALNIEIEKGTTRAIGCANHNKEQLLKSIEVSEKNKISGFQVIQTPFSLVQSQSKELFPICDQKELSITAHSPLGAGFLTGKYTPDKSKLPQGSRYHIMPGHADIYFSDKNFQILEKLNKKSEDLQISPIQLAISWSINHSEISSVLIGARTTEHIDNSIKATQINLSISDKSEMDSWII